VSASATNPPVPVAESTATYEAVLRAEPIVATSWLTTAGLWCWRLRLAFGSSTVSATVHGAAVIALALIAAPEPIHHRTVIVRQLEATLEKVDEQKELTPKLLAQVKIEVKPSVASIAPANASASGAGSAGSGGGSGGGAAGGLQLAGLGIGPNSVRSGGTGFGTDDAYGAHMLGEVGELADPSATFFGVKADGRKFVFVVDTSGSMALNARFLRCRNELLRSLASMQYGQQYFVVFFNHTTFPMPEHKLVDARPAQLKKTAEWVVGAVPAGGTEPWDGLALALRMKPDAIYLLTDGQFDPKVVDKTIAAQPESKKIPIHTIAFESLEGARLLETISRASGGQHLFVP